MRNLLLTILSLLLLAACTNTALRTKHTALTKADSLMHTHPDSALALLQSISADSLTDDANRAYHALLLSQALDKNYIDKTDDSLINIAVTYYADKPVTPQQMLAHYYHARIKQNAKAYPEALYSALHAEAAALQLNDHYHLGLIYRLMMECYNKTYDFTKQLHYARLSCKHFEQTSYTRYTSYAKVLVANAYMACEKFDESLNILPKFITQAESMNDTLLLLNSLNCYSHALTLSGNYELAKIQLNRLKLFPRYRWKNSNYSDLISIYNYEQNTDSMQYYLQILRQTATTKEDEYLVKKAQELIALQNDNHELAYESTIIKYAIKDSILQRADSVSLPIKQVEYYAQTKLQDSNLTKMRLTILTLLLLIVLLIIIIIFKLHQRKKKEEIIQLILSLQKSEENTILQKQIIEKYNKDNKNLYQLSEILKKQVRDLINALSEPYKYYLQDIEEGKVNDISLRMTKSIIFEFRKKQHVDKLEYIVNACSDNLMCKIRKELSLKETDYQLCVFLLAGYPFKFIAYILNITTNTLYQRKHHLKEIISSSSLKDDEIICERLL